MSKRKSASPETTADQGTTIDDAPDIPPALSSHEWAAWRGQRVNPVTMQREVSAFAPNPDNLWKTIAIANDQLHDEDPRKMLPRTVDMLRDAAKLIAIAQEDATDDDHRATLGTLYSELHEFADVIASLLPQED